MSSMIEALVAQVWHWLPAMTEVFRFAAALISFGLATAALARRVRGRTASLTRRRAPAPAETKE